MLRVLQITDETKRDAEKVKAYAIAHPYDEAYRELFKLGEVKPVGDNPEHLLHIHDGYRVIYSISMIESKKYHHISISVESNEGYPSVPAAMCITELFGMGNDITALDNVWMEENVRAVNMIKELV